MRILIDYRNLLNSLLSFGTDKPLEQIDRVWEALKENTLETYISKRGLDTIQQEIAYHSGYNHALKVVTKLQHILRLCPPANLQQVRNFAHTHGGNSYEEALEVYSAFSISADGILSNSPHAYSPFGLLVVQLNHQVDASSLYAAKTSSSLPILLVGDLADVWFIFHAKTSKSHLAPSNLTKWFRNNIFEHGWHPLEELLVSSNQQLAFRRRTVRRGKLIQLKSNRENTQESFTLIITVMDPANESNITVELLSAETSVILPPSLALKILDSNGVCIEQEMANGRSAMMLEIDGEESEFFSVIICNKDLIHKEDFLI